MASIVNDRDEVLQAAASRLNIVSSDNISFSASAPSFNVNGSTVTPTSITISFQLNGRLQGTPTISTTGLSSVTTVVVSPVLTQVSVPYANMTADSCSITASLSFAGNTYTSTASIAGSMSPPAQVGAGTIVPEGLLLRLTWPKNTEIDVSGYEVRSADSGWGIDTSYLFRGDSITCALPVLAPTTTGSVKTFYVKAYDATNLFSSTARALTYTIAAPTAPTGLGATFSSSSATTSTIALVWNTTIPAFGLKQYKVVATLPDTSVKTWYTNTPNLSIDASWTGNASVVVYVTDILGNESLASTALSLAKNPPNTVTFAATPVSVVGAKLLLDWVENTKPASGLPVVAYEVRAANTGWGDGTTHLWKGSVSECQVTPGALNTAITYYIKAIDSDNIYSTTAAFTPYTRLPPPAVTAATYTYSTSSVGQSTVMFAWSRPANETFAIDFYRVSITKPGNVTTTIDTYSNSWEINADWEGTSTLTIQTVDIFGATSSTFTKSIYKAPISTTNYTTSNPTPVGDTLLLTWTPSLSKTGVSWTRVAGSSTITINDTAHGYVTGNYINVTSASDTTTVPVDTYIVTVINATSYTITGVNIGATAGTITITNGSLQVAEYEVRASDNSTVLYRGASAKYAVQGNNITPGLNTYYLYAIDSAGKYSLNNKSITYTYNLLSGITVNYVYTSTGTALFKWNVPTTGSFAVQEYAVAISTLGLSATLYTTDWEIPFAWSNGSVTLTVTPKDVLGRVGTAGSVTATNALPSTPGIVTPTLRGTDLELDWPDNVINTSTQLPISRYEIRDSGGTVVWKGSQSKAVLSLVGLTPANRIWNIYAYDTTNTAVCATPRQYEYLNLTLPDDVPANSISASFGTNISDSLLTISWTAQSPRFGLKQYKITYQDGDTLVTTASLTNSINISPIPKYPSVGGVLQPWVGDKVFTIKVVDQLNNESPLGSSITVAKNKPGNITTYTAQVIDNNVLLSWVLPARTTLPIDTVRIKRGAEGSTWNTATLIGDKTGTFTTILERSGSRYLYWVTAVDSDGVESQTPTSILATVAQPPDYVFVGQQFSNFTGGIMGAISTSDKGTGVTVLDNVVTGTGGAGGWQSARGTKSFTTGKWYWEVKVVSIGNYPNTWMAGVATSALAVASQYVGQDAASWGYYGNANTLIGPNGAQVASGTTAFASDDILSLALDTAAGTLKQYKNGVLFATMTGVTGTLYPAVTTFGYFESLYVNLGEKAFAYPIPDGYNGYTNAGIDGTSLMLPIDRTSSWSQHFVTGSGTIAAPVTWATPDAQIAAGFPVYIQPTVASGSYEEIFDFGTVLSSTKITVNLVGITVAGTVTVTTTIDVSTTPTGWQGPTAGTSLLGTNFRYVKVKISVTQADGGKGTYRLTSLDIALDAKQKSDSGSANMVIGGAHPQGNVAHDYVSLWKPTPAAMPTTQFSYSSAGENTITNVAGPGGFVQPIWNCWDIDVASDWEGGWNTTNFAANLTTGHLFAVLMLTTTNNGTSYWGTSQDGSILNLAGTANTNPYFWNGDLPSLGAWYLVVGYVHAIGYSGADNGFSGVYALDTKTKVQAGTEYKAAAGTTSLMHRAYHYYNVTNSGTIVQQMARPVVIPCTLANVPNMINYLLQCSGGYGVTVTPSTSFIDVVSITATPQGITPTTPLVDFTDIPYPSRFNLFNYNSSGSAVGGTVSWAMKGY